MVQLSEEPVLSPEQVTLYYAADPYLSNLPVLVFHGQSSTTNSTLNSSRIQLHVFSAAGFQSYPRITLSPNSPLYSAVSYLPRDLQGDELSRGIAFGLFKYFQELPEIVKGCLMIQYATAISRKQHGPAPTLFCEQHAADLAKAMIKVDNVEEVIRDIEVALRPQHIEHIDVDLVLPPGSIASLEDVEQAQTDGEEYEDPSIRRYGVYSPLVKLFGEVAFLPTSKLRRAPSKAIKRSKSFLKNEKLALRREMDELVDTEERYVIKLHELVNEIAEEYRKKAKHRSFGSSSPSAQDLEKLFPPCLDKILEINKAFLTAIQKVMDDTEEGAMKDLENEQTGSTGSRYGGHGRLRDPTGAHAFSRVLLEWFPQFSDSYQEYIRASQEFPQIITTFMKQQSSFSQRVQQTGEQHLRSAIIEPVQRLPRYSLFIDNIVNYLPDNHPAQRTMLEARDIITAICSLDPPADDKSQVVNRLRHIVEGWPFSFQPKGRLISAVDFVESSAPFHIPNLQSQDSREGMLLLFSDYVVLVKKAHGCKLSARGVLAEVDKPSAATMMASATAAAGGQKHEYELSFRGWHALSDTRFMTSDDRQSLWMSSSRDLKDPGTRRDRTASAATVRAFWLKGSYEGKAAKWMEEVAKARVEGRFSETERDSEKWSFRSVRLDTPGITFHTAVFEEGIDTLITGRKEPAPIRIVVDHQKGTKGAPVGHYGVDIVANLIVTKPGTTYRLEVDGLNDRVFLDEVLPEHVLQAFGRRVSDLLRLQHNVSNPALNTPFISFHIKVLKSLYLVAESDKLDSFRPSSPVKKLSKLLGGFSNPTSTLTRSKSAQSQALLGAMLSVPPSLDRSNSSRSTFSSLETEGKTSVRVTAEETQPDNPLIRLEETFTGYISALQSRKGNVVGKQLRSRAAADELSINEAYNAFMDSPFDNRSADESPFEVIFVSFEKFLRIAWKEQMGPVMSLETLDALQEKAQQLFPGDFADYVKMVFNEMAPQNRRSFVSTIKLLADLLDGCGNDGDRGALTVAFAELLVTESDPHNYINLLDRMVEDIDRIFEDIGPGASTTEFGYSSYSRSIHSTSGSITSNTSSIRRRWADTLLRSNSRRDDPDARPSLWRGLSRSSRSTATGEPLAASTFSRAALGRSRSIDVRPGSRDRPTVLGGLPFEDRPKSSHTPDRPERLSTIGGSPSEEPAPESRSAKKRRSSLSDLKTLLAATSLEGDDPHTPSPPGRSQKRQEDEDCSQPRTPSPTKIPISTGSRSSFSRPRSAKGESEPIITTLRSIGNLTERPNNIMSPPEVHPFRPTLSAKKGHMKTNSLSNIPTLHSAFRDRTGSIVRPTTSHSNPLAPNSPVKSTPKFRLQSPQKLRERLQNESKAITEAESSFQAELSKIGEEMSKFTSTAMSSSIYSGNKDGDLAAISSSVKALESRIPVLIKDIQSRHDSIAKDLETSLQASEFKCKGLDQLYKEASAENELLYEKFNNELGKIVKALKGKGKEDREELMQRVKDSSEEATRVRKENARLRRELLTMRTLLKGNELNSLSKANEVSNS
ncbi:hypothetical protein F5884DRAFT_382965 [Xylogone sp. PMI_703]|nr:hypothetical protein F5884DRAFT_382965 [Xylogone sp. PMI_703]